MYISNNAYSGLNSLRGGLKHSYWSGSSLLDTTTFQSESWKAISNYTISLKYAVWLSGSPFLWIPIFFSYADGECIGTPIYFFFASNTVS